MIARLYYVGIYKMAICYKCDEVLSDENWMPSFRNRGQCICKSCYRESFNSKNNKVNNPLALYINGKYISRKDPRYKMFKPGHYKILDDSVVSSKENNDSKIGYVYVITNKAWAGWVKIGMAFDAEDRLKGYQTGSPFRDYVLEYSVYSDDRRKAEQQAHTKAAKLASEVQGEWFKLPVDQAKKVLDSIVVHVTIKEEPKQVEDKPLDLFSYAERLG